LQEVRRSQKNSNENIEREREKEKEKEKEKKATLTSSFMAGISPGFCRRIFLNPSCAFRFSFISR